MNRGTSEERAKTAQQLRAIIALVARLVLSKRNVPVTLKERCIYIVIIVGLLAIIYDVFNPFLLRFMRIISLGLN